MLAVGRRFVWLLACLLIQQAQASPLSEYWYQHFEARISIVSAQAKLLGTHKVVLYGDSNTEMQWWNQNAGCFVINAGMAGARIRDLAKGANTVAAITNPSIVHIMVGTNNVYGLSSGDEDIISEWQTMEEDAHSIVAAFKSRGSKVVVWPIPPFAQGFANSADRTYVNDIWKRVVDAEGGAESGVYWDWWWPNQITTGAQVGALVKDGFAVPGALLSDGVHLSPTSQASRFYRMEVWKSTLSVVC